MYVEGTPEEGMICHVLFKTLDRKISLYAHSVKSRIQLLCPENFGIEQVIGLLSRTKAPGVTQRCSASL